MSKQGTQKKQKSSFADGFVAGLFTGFVGGVLKILGLVFVCFVAYSMIDSQIVLADKQATLKKLEEQKQELMISNEEKKELIEKSDQDEFVEQIAREYFGFAYPDEQIYIDISGS